MTKEEFEKSTMEAYIKGFHDAVNLLTEAAKDVNLDVFTEQLKKAKEKEEDEQ